MKHKYTSLSLLVLLTMLTTNSCSLEKLAMKKVAGMLSSPSGNNVFTQDNDPELVGDALPFAIKLYESLLASVPDHSGLRLRTGSLYIMYANAFIQTPADMIPNSEMEKKEFMLARAKNLYLRGRNMLLAGLEKKYPGFGVRLNEKKFSQAFQTTKKEDIPYLYWTAAGWMGAFAIDPFDMKLGLTLPQASALMQRISELDPDYDRGVIHDFYILYYGSLPEYMGGDLKKAREHFQKSLAASGPQATSAYIALATTVSVKDQNVEEFRELLQKTLAVDPDRDIDTRLLTILNQRKARWLLNHVEDFFLLEEETDSSPAEEKEES